MFGRDALTTGWQAAMIDCGEMFDSALTMLARLQATERDTYRDAEPGRIAYQLRRSPAARLAMTPEGLSYADFASSLMYPVALAHLYAWTGDRTRVERHWDTVRRALDWARHDGDRDRDGYLEYQTVSPQGPRHQGWKDSERAVVYEDGREVPAPVATCELQGYWFAALQLTALMSALLGRFGDARAYWAEATGLKERFNRDWWIEEEGFYALALDPDKRPVRSVASNVGHCLAAGIVNSDRLARVVGRLFAPDMFSGWGIRTLSNAHPAFHPLSYHVGSVWPVENATIAFGLRRYGFDARALDIAHALFQLAERYPEYRVPECVGGYPRGTWPSPGAFPISDPLQAWNVSAFPLLVHTILALQPFAPGETLFVDPALPPWLPEIVLSNLRIAGAIVSLRFIRDESGESTFEVLQKRGTLRVVRQPPPESQTAGFADRLSGLFESLT
jgi:glycogen debranching enzyme